jgi:Domain of unknown function (DUF2019)
VLLNGAKATLAVAPVQARKVIQEISDSKLYPQAGSAGICLFALDEGIFKPDCLRASALDALTNADPYAA